MENKLANYNQISDRIKLINNNINEFAIKYGKNPNNISLMAVTKTRTPQEVNTAINCGIRLLGENKAQELSDRYEDYDKTNVDIHFIGHLQRNKVKQIVDKVNLIHSVDSLDLAEEINKQSEKIQKVMNVLVEVNIGNEESKFGISPENLLDFCYKLTEFKNLRLNGLMAIPPKATNTLVEKYFENMYRIFVDIKAKKYDNICMDILSMGMSGDYINAVINGSNLVRIGSAIFGARIY